MDVAHDPTSPRETRRGRYRAAQLRGDRRGASAVILEEGLAGGFTTADLQAVVQEAQREIGRLWEENRVSIAQEHMATAISQIVLAHLYDRAERARDRGQKLWVACVEGELHDLPARLAADTADLAGFDVRFLGANVPTDSLVEMVRAERPDVLALSVTLSFNVPALRTAVSRLREAFGDGLPLVIGGNALRWAPTLAAHLGVRLFEEMYRDPFWEELSRELAIKRIRDALEKAGVGAVRKE
ncbi:B12-binding domain-containing protein [Vulgatibacter sp.]|uniref:cobalamin B12-binding domain-containing protein n=1 Tax=Vulgatibacter sp. TaxID=1971226 RepID=UPI0035699B80